MGKIAQTVSCVVMLPTIGCERPVLGQAPTRSPSPTTQETGAFARPKKPVKVIPWIEVNSTRFIDFSLDLPAAPQYRAWKISQAKLDSVARRPTIPLAYFGTFATGHSCWPYQQAPAVVARARGEEIIFYLPGRDWVNAARSLTQALSGTHAQERP